MPLLLRKAVRLLLGEAAEEIKETKYFATLIFDNDWSAPYFDLQSVLIYAHVDKGGRIDDH